MEYYGKTHVGLRRKENQDSICVLENKHHNVMAVVCDGIGGGNAGDVASKLATDYMETKFLEIDICGQRDVDVKHWLKETIQEANDLIFAQATKKLEQKGMGTTMVGALVCDQATYIFNVGDSRLYGLYKDDFICLTEDHTYVADLLRRGEVSEEEAKNHPNRNVLINALGIWDHIRIDISKIKNDYQSLLICSDGLHGYVHEDVIRHTLESNIDTKAKSELLIQAALKVGGYDNVSAIVIEKDGGKRE